MFATADAGAGGPGEKNAQTDVAGVDAHWLDCVDLVLPSASALSSVSLSRRLFFALDPVQWLLVCGIKWDKGPNRAGPKGKRDTRRLHHTRRSRSPRERTRAVGLPVLPRPERSYSFDGGRLGATAWKVPGNLRCHSATDDGNRTSRGSSQLEAAFHMALVLLTMMP